MICKILGLFVNPLTANDIYSLLNRGNLFQDFQMQLFQKQKRFAEFFFSNFQLLAIADYKYSLLHIDSL